MVILLLFINIYIYYLHNETGEMLYCTGYNNYVKWCIVILYAVVSSLMQWINVLVREGSLSMRGTV